MSEKRPRSFYFLAAFFIAYVLFLYGPMFAIYVLSFQGPDGGLTFPMNGVSLTWFGKVFSGTGIVDIGAAFKRSLKHGLPQIVPGRDIPVLYGDRQPDHALDHHLARYRIGVPAA